MPYIDEVFLRKFVLLAEGFLELCPGVGFLLYRGPSSPFTEFIETACWFQMFSSGFKTFAQLYVSTIFEHRGLQRVPWTSWLGFWPDIYYEL